MQVAGSGNDSFTAMNRRILSWIPALLLAVPLAAAPPATPLTPIPPPADVAAPPADAQVTASGLASKVLTPGTGTEHPMPADLVKVHYTGWTTDGKMFDSSLQRGTPATFELTKVIPGWTDVLQRMVEGETRRVWIPSRQAYDGAPGKPRGMLVFEITLLEIVKE